MARFAANKPDGTLTKSFDEIKNPGKMTLSLAFGWGWGEAGQGSDSVSFMLLNPKGDGYLFKVHRVKANWAVQWAKVAGGSPSGDAIWASEEIDASHAAVRDGGGLCHLTVTRTSDGGWSVFGKDWNKGAGATVRFSDTSTTSFSRLVLVGTRNFDEQVFNKIRLTIGGGDTALRLPSPRPISWAASGSTRLFPIAASRSRRQIEMIKYPQDFAG